METLKSARPRQRFAIGAVIATFLAAMAPNGAHAQGLNNQPFEFGSSGSGMSIAGRQLILGQKLFGLRPEHVIRGPGGVLLFVNRGPSGIAFLVDWAGQPVVGVRRSWKGSGFAFPQQAAYFVDDYDSQNSTAAALAGWTMLVNADTEDIFANLLLPGGMDSLDAWMWQVYSLSEY